MDTTTPLANFIITINIPALSEYIAYLKDEHQAQQQKKIAQLTAQLKISSTALASSETSAHIG